MNQPKAKEGNPASVLIAAIVLALVAAGAWWFWPKPDGGGGCPVGSRPTTEQETQVRCSGDAAVSVESRSGGGSVVCIYDGSTTRQCLPDCPGRVKSATAKRIECFSPIPPPVFHVTAEARCKRGESAESSAICHRTNKPAKGENPHNTCEACIQVPPSLPPEVIEIDPGRGDFGKVLQRPAKSGRQRCLKVKHWIHDQDRRITIKANWDSYVQEPMTLIEATSPVRSGTYYWRHVKDCKMVDFTVSITEPSGRRRTLTKARPKDGPYSASVEGDQIRMSL